MAKKKQVRMSREVKNFIIDKMEGEGLLPEQICKKYPTKVPHITTIYRYQRSHPDFEEEMNKAYGCWLMSKHAELEYISTAPLTELFPELEDRRDAYEARRARIDALKFTLGKMAPVLSARFNKVTKVENTGNSPQIVIQKYTLDDIEEDNND